ncbi:MAG: GAF domain-containing protein [Mucilaginibacter sp.]|uniref:GAF domain-containing protein n=1 Tax=Mucilaginibacter sp. TaxID=1882438 RepID=UPI0031A5501B
MDLKRYEDSPVQTSISFHLLIKHLESVAVNGTGFSAQPAQLLLNYIEPYSELRTGTTDPAQLLQYAEIITELLADLFPAVLTGNEMKAVTVPFQNVLLNPTKRLQKVLTEAGPSFDIAIRGFTDHQFYVNSCCLILNARYGTNFNFNRSLFYDIPNAQGIMKHYRILYNTDFMELTPTDKAVDINPEDIELLRDNFDDLELWKKYFPKESWSFKGFAIVSLFDATVESAVSVLKGTLLGGGYGDDINDKILDVFRSIFRIPDLDVGFTSFHAAENKFSLSTFNSKLKSYILKDKTEEECSVLLRLVQQQKYFTISDVEQLLKQNPENVLARRLLDQNVRSVILAPVVKNGHQLGIIELVSSKTGELNSINANQLETVMPYITDTLDRQNSFMQNQVEALIQNEYTTIHPSVCWKFRKEAQKALKARSEKKEYTLKAVTFKDVTPLYGQIDIKGSSNMRNNCVQLDLLAQLNAVVPLLKKVYNDDTLKEIQELEALITNIQIALRADTEQYVQNYLEAYIHPMLKAATIIEPLMAPAIDNYFLQTEKTGDYHLNRRKYDDTLTLINQKMASLLDQAQVEAQSAYPHYYERYKTDGVEHNLYIGASIAPTLAYDITKLYNLRLWQLQVMCQMEQEYHILKNTLPYQPDVTSLILAYNNQMSVRFRLDEKRFDVDGSYNARFEIIKKRIDKACIKNTTERLTQVGKIAIIYSNQDEEVEYMGYISFLQANKLFAEEIELLEVEDLQGVSGLKALRVSVRYDVSWPLHKFCSYNDMMQQHSSTYFPTAEL